MHDKRFVICAPGKFLIYCLIGVEFAWEIILRHIYVGTDTGPISKFLTGHCIVQCL